MSLPAVQVLGFLNAWSDGGVGMWVILIHFLTMLVLGWGYAIAQILSFVAWRKKIGALTPIAEIRNATGLQEELRGSKDSKPKGLIAEILMEASEAVLRKEAPKDILNKARKTLHHSLAGIHPFKGIVTVLVLLLCLVAPLLLGALFENVGLMHGFAALASAMPGERCELMMLMNRIANIPAIFGLIVTLLLAPPALIAVFLDLTFLGAKRKRDDILRLVDLLVGVEVRPPAGIVPGIVSMFFVVVLGGAALWLISGPEVSKLMAPMLYQPCIFLEEGPELTIPVGKVEAGTVEDTTFVTIRKDAVTTGYQRSATLSDGKPDPADVTAGQLQPLITDLHQEKDVSRSLCEYNPSSSACGGSLLVVIDESTPLSTTALVLHTCNEVWGGKLALLVRSEQLPEKPMQFSDYLDEVQSIKGLTCVENCPYGLIEIKEVIPGLKGDRKSSSVLDGSADGTFGEFISNLEQDAIVVARAR